MKSLINSYLALCAAFSSTAAVKAPEVHYTKISNPLIQQPSNVKHSHEHRIHDDELNKFRNITLDYGIHVPTLKNEDAGYILYRNIRYGQNPTGDLRFALPKAPKKVEGDLPVFNGSDGQSCYQAFPQWAINSQLIANPEFDWTHEFRTETDGEDCLFLDVATPLEVVEGEKYPVLVWIYGGGYVYGAKDMSFYSPAGFYRRATGNNKFLYVALNYRMGAFGFLSGPAFSTQGGQPNLGLHDQRLALKWIQDNIEKFGGDPNQVTVMGESAGAGSIVHQLVWTEKDTKTPFQKAILQSPAWVPVPGTPEGFSYQDDIYDSFLELLEVNDLRGAREKDINDIVAANRELVTRAPYGTFSVGPVVDRINIEAHPLAILSSEEQNRTAVQIFTGVVAGEGLIFVPLLTVPPPERPWEWLTWKDKADANLYDYIIEALPLLDPATAAEILDVYPRDDPKYSYLAGEYIGISRQTQRLADIAGQALVQCNARGIATSHNSDTYHYIFSRVDDEYPNSVLHIPVLHGGDVPYTFYDLPPSPEKPSFNKDVAEEWQKYLMGFVLESDPNYLRPTTNMSKYGAENKAILFHFEDIAREVQDPFAGALCDAMWPGVWRAYGEYGPGGHQKADEEGMAKSLSDVWKGVKQDVLALDQDELK